MDFMLMGLVAFALTMAAFAVGENNSHTGRKH